MTFSQLRTFALVAELGSLRAAAAALGVSEPAVSAALAALRSDLGDPLFVRSGGGISLTAGGRALAGRARELVRLADRTRRDVARAGSTTGALRILASGACAEHLEQLLAAFTDRVPDCAVEVRVGGDDVAAGLAEDLYDIALGPWPQPLPGQSLESVPFLRYRRVVVAAPGHPLAAGGPVAPADLLRHRWLAGPGGFDPGGAEARWARGLGEEPVPDRLGSEAEALDAARSGQGVVLALVHMVAADLRRGSLVLLPVEGTPVEGLWWSTVPGSGRAGGPARALQRFLTTPDATSALLARPRRAGRTRPTVRVELWS
ncbi:LysR family transcriptional regulator [Geodermatophilus sp. URMC 64]